jgi:hypothetical protein
MGSSGSGNFSDYPGSSKNKETGGSGGGESSGGDRCARAFSVSLEDVEHCDYFKNHGSACPANGTVLEIAQKKRIVAQTSAGEIVGNLPTQFNYLAACLRDGYTYAGQVRSSNATGLVAVVSADFAAIPPK